MNQIVRIVDKANIKETDTQAILANMNMINGIDRKVRFYKHIKIPNLKGVVSLKVLEKLRTEKL